MLDKKLKDDEIEYIILSDQREIKRTNKTKQRHIKTLH